VHQFVNINISSYVHCISDKIIEVILGLHNTIPLSMAVCLLRGTDCTSLCPQNFSYEKARTSKYTDVPRNVGNWDHQGWKPPSLSSVTLDSTNSSANGLVYLVSNLIQRLHGPTLQTAEDNNKFPRHICAY